MGFNLDDYEPVAARLSRWIESCRERGVQHRVETALMEYTDSRCVFRATIFEGDVAVATGHAEETRGEGHVNRTSHLENCETGALGRALANAGWAGSDVSKRPSREEMSKVVRTEGGGRVVNLDDRPGRDRPATEAQRSTVRRMAVERGIALTEPEIQALTAREASERIGAMKDVPRV